MVQTSEDAAADLLKVALRELREGIGAFESSERARSFRDCLCSLDEAGILIGEALAREGGLESAAVAERRDEAKRDALGD